MAFCVIRHSRSSGRPRPVPRTCPHHHGKRRRLAWTDASHGTEHLHTREVPRPFVHWFATVARVALLENQFLRREVVVDAVLDRESCELRQMGPRPPQLVEQLGAVGHAAANPSRQLGCAGRQLELALGLGVRRAAECRSSSPRRLHRRTGRPTSSAARASACWPPSSCASAGSHSATVAGSSSTTL